MHPIRSEHPAAVNSRFCKARQFEFESFIKCLYSPLLTTPLFHLLFNPWRNSDQWWCIRSVRGNTGLLWNVFLFWCVWLFARLFQMDLYRLHMWRVFQTPALFPSPVWVIWADVSVEVRLVCRPRHANQDRQCVVRTQSGSPDWNNSPSCT